MHVYQLAWFVFQEAHRGKVTLTPTYQVDKINTDNRKCGETSVLHSDVTSWAFHPINLNRFKRTNKYVRACLKLELNWKLELGH